MAITWTRKTELAGGYCTVTWTRTDPDNGPVDVEGKPLLDADGNPLPDVRTYTFAGEGYKLVDGQAEPLNDCKEAAFKLYAAEVDAAVVSFDRADAAASASATQIEAANPGKVAPRKAQQL